jgi:hypothetical protein
VGEGFYSAAMVKYWMVAKSYKLIEPPPFVPDFPPADLSSTPSIKKELPCKTLTQEIFKTMWEGAVRNIAKEDFATTFQQRQYRNFADFFYLLRFAYKLSKHRSANSIGASPRTRKNRQTTDSY